MNSQTRARTQLPRIDFHKALCEGAADAALENAALDGYPHKFSKPGEHVAVPRVKPIVSVSMTAEEFVKALRLKTRR